MPRGMPGRVITHGIRSLLPGRRRGVSQSRRQVGLGEPLGQQMKDFIAGVVGGGLQQLVGVFGSQSGRQGHDAREVQASLGHRREDRGKLARRTGGVDPFGGCVFRETELADAVLLHARIGRRQVEPALVELGDMSEDIGIGGASPRDDCLQAAIQLAVAEVGERVAVHDPNSSGGWSDHGAAGATLPCITRVRGALRAAESSRSAAGRDFSWDATVQVVRARPRRSDARRQEPQRGRARRMPQAVKRDFIDGARFSTHADREDPRWGSSSSIRYRSTATRARATLPP